MEYTELYICTASETQSEIVMAVLADWPFDSFESAEDSLRAFIVSVELPACRARIEEYLKGEKLEYSFREIETVNWNELWESNFQPVEVEGKFHVRAPFHEPSGGCENIIIMPKMSFGTGHHATTWLMLSEIADRDLSGLAGLDMGSGTGVLAVAAVKRGAVSVDAVDIDRWAWENCMENVQVNGVEGEVKPIQGDISAVKGYSYDFILANINRNILMEHLPEYRAALHPGGFLLMSGILEEDVPIITARAVSEGFRVDKTAERGGWAVVVTTLPAER